MNESDLQAAIIETLLYDGWLVLRVNQGAMRESDRLIRFAYWQVLGEMEKHAGISDVMAFKDDMPALFIEVKLPGKQPTANQDLFLRTAREHGAIALVVSSVDNLAPYLERVAI